MGRFIFYFLLLSSLASTSWAQEPEKASLTPSSFKFKLELEVSRLQKLTNKLSAVIIDQQKQKAPNYKEMCRAINLQDQSFSQLATRLVLVDQALEVAHQIYETPEAKQLQNRVFADPIDLVEKVQSLGPKMQLALGFCREISFDVPINDIMTPPVAYQNFQELIEVETQIAETLVDLEDVASRLQIDDVPTVDLTRAFRDLINIHIGRSNVINTEDVAPFIEFGEVY